MVRVAALLLCAVSLSACSWGASGMDGNPSKAPYAGEPGSAFDANAGPPRPTTPEPSGEMAAAATPMATGPQSPAAPLPTVSQPPAPSTPR